MAAVFGQQYAPGAVFGAQESTSGLQSVTAPLVDSGGQTFAPIISVAGPQTITVPLVDSGAEVFPPRFGDQEGHGFVIVDFEPKLWWKRKPKALDKQEAAQKVEAIARKIERVAVKQVKSGRVVEPVVTKPEKTEVLQAIAPQLQEMPGFDPIELYRAILARLIEQQRQAEMQAAELARQEIERIRLFEQDEDDVLILLMGA